MPDRLSAIASEKMLGNSNGDGTTLLRLLDPCACRPNILGGFGWLWQRKTTSDMTRQYTVDENKARKFYLQGGRISVSRYLSSRSGSLGEAQAAMCNPSCDVSFGTVGIGVLAANWAVEWHSTPVPRRPRRPRLPVGRWLGDCYPTGDRGLRPIG